MPPGADAPDAVTLDELFAEDEAPYDWLVPGLIERGDRIVVTGDEGWGKSTLLRQQGLAATAGMNPFANTGAEAHHRPVRVLLVDCENSQRQLRREFPKAWRSMKQDDLGAARRRLWQRSRTEGLVLDDPADRQGDRAWLARQVRTFQPDLLLIGPLYKLQAGDPNAEAESRNVALFLRTACRGPGADMAIMVEAPRPP